MSGLLYQLRDDFPQRLRLARANSQTNSSTVVRYSVRGTPTVFLFHKGRQVKRWQGRVDVDELYALVEAALEEEDRAGAAAG